MFLRAPYNDLYEEALPKRVLLSEQTIPRFEIRKFAKFQSDLLKTNEDEDIARPQSREILQTFVWWRSGTVLVTPPPPSTPITYKTQQIFATLRSYIVAYLRRNTFKFGNFTATEMKIILKFIN